MHFLLAQKLMGFRTQSRLAVFGCQTLFAGRLSACDSSAALGCFLSSDARVAELIRQKVTGCFRNRVIAACCLLMLSGVVTIVIAEDGRYIGKLHTLPSGLSDSLTVARGRVFEDLNRNSLPDADEPGIQGVAVSNGREVVLSDAAGNYELPAYDDMNLFVTRPFGYVVPVNKEMVPQFAYIHKIDGSPDLRFGGLSPTGPLPAEINFPMIKSARRTDFSCLVFGDAQAYTHREISYVRQTVGNMLAARESNQTDCLIFAGDIVGDDLSLLPRFKQIVSVGQVPVYFVGGNHDVDFDAENDADSFDTFRREWGPEYYSFDIGNVHFVGLDNVRYPCNGVDPHPFCSADKRSTYNGVVSGRQIEWLKNDLAHVPDDKLIVLVAHIPFVSFTDPDSTKHQTDNLHELYDVLGDRPTLGLTGHTHTTENIEPGEHFKGWQKATGTGPAHFHQIITGAVSGAWWAGDLNDQQVPHGTQRHGSPRGYYELAFNGSAYVDTYRTFGADSNAQFHTSFNSPRFRRWAEQLLRYRDLHTRGFKRTPLVSVNDIDDINMLTTADLQGGSWAVVNVWNGSRSTRVEIILDNSTVLQGRRTQDGDGEGKRKGIQYADPLALMKQATQGRVGLASTSGDGESKGFTTWRGTVWAGKPGPFYRWMLTDSSPHLWRVDLPDDLSIGIHRMLIRITDRHGRSFEQHQVFEVVDSLPEFDWQASYWETE